MSERAEVLETVRSRVASLSRVPPERVRPEGRFIDYGINSVQALDLVVDLEERYGIEVPDEVLPRLRTLEDLVTYVLMQTGSEG